MKSVMPSFVLAALLAPSAMPAQSYPIDCAILLCLGGGFPASAECSAAKIEVIRRVTPWPIEPPLQLWNCPLNAGAISLPNGGGSSNRLPSEILQYRSGIEVWQVQKTSTNSSGGRETSVNAVRYAYDADGDFVSSYVSVNSIPDWVNSAVFRHAGTSLGSTFGSVRGILLKLEDYAGEVSTDWVGY